MGIVKKIKRYLEKRRLNKRIAQVKHVHLMFNDKFNKPFVDFLNRNFDPKEHLILCKRLFSEFPFPDGENVAEIKSYKGLVFNNSGKVICHSLFDCELVDYLFTHKDVLQQKAYWVIWGGDLYNATEEKSEKEYFVKANCKGYISVIDGDCQKASEKYNSTPQTFNACYTAPITKGMLDNKKEKHDYIRVQINNSCDRTTLEMLDILSRFKTENIKIKTVLSYGEMSAKDEIIQKGERIFGENFEHIDTLLTPEEYATEMARNDILVLNLDRQQGAGNCSASLAVGVKVFVKKEVTMYNYFSSHGIKLFDTRQIERMSFREFASYDKKVKQENIEKALVFFDYSVKRKRWEKVF